MPSFADAILKSDHALDAEDFATESPPPVALKMHNVSMTAEAKSSTTEEAKLKIDLTSWQARLDKNPEKNLRQEII